MMHRYSIRLLIPAAFFFAISALAQTDKRPASESKDGSVQISEPSRLKLGGFYLGAGYGRFSRPYPLLFWPGYYDQGFSYGSYGYPFGYYSPYLYSGLYNSYGRGPNMGEVRLKTNVEDAQVFLDGALAGDAKDLKDIWLEP